MTKFNTVDEYIGSLEDEQARVAGQLRAMVHDEVPEAIEAIKWAQPVFELDGPFCYIKAFQRYVNLGFFRGATLPDPAGILEGTGDRMRHVKLAHLDDIQEGPVRELIRQAVALNVREGDPTEMP
ncbi:MAG TPA: DUF1801 domain-containing protein [Anaerolineae bacterium]|nr:DUF1801 domain-containing protein [Anaerolineae bacterium]